MSLYFDAVSVLTAPPEAGGSLKSRIYNSRLKSSPPQIYALITETTKWNAVLKEVVNNSDILAHEPKVGFFLPFAGCCSFFGTSKTTWVEKNNRI